MSSSIVDSQSIKVIAESVGIAELPEDISEALAPEVEYRLRDIVQEALKFMRSGRRDSLSTEDINYALRLRSCEPLYGYAAAEAPRFLRAVGAPAASRVWRQSCCRAPVDQWLPCAHWPSIHNAQWFAASLCAREATRRQRII